MHSSERSKRRIPTGFSTLGQAVCVCVALMVPALGADWPQWRGPQRTGHTAAGEPVLETLPAEPKTVWKVASGFALSSPVVAGERVLYMEQADGKEVLVSAKRETGERVWAETIDSTFTDTQATPGPRCTPMVDGDRAYAVSCRGELQCREAGSGKLLWRKNYTQDFEAVFIGERGTAMGATRHGNDGCPLIAGDRLYACAGGTNGAGIVCLNKNTGEVIWKSQNDTAAYAPPTIEKPGSGAPQLLCFTAEAAIGLQPADGKLLWRFPVKTSYGRHVGVPLVYEDVVVVSSHEAGLIGLRVSGAAPDCKVEQAWVSKEAAVNFTSSVLVGDHLYSVGAKQDFVCVEMKTGALKWSKPGYFTSAAGKAHAGLIVMGKSVLALTDTGELVLFKANPAEFRELGRAQVCGANWCNPAYVDGRIYLRDAKSVYCIALR